MAVQVLLGGAKIHEHGPLKPKYQKFKARIVILLAKLEQWPEPMLLIRKYNFCFFKNFK